MIESQHTEFKRNWRDDYLKWIAGFANAEGGRLLLGIADDYPIPIQISVYPDKMMIWNSGFFASELDNGSTTGQARIKTV